MITWRPVVEVWFPTIPSHWGSIPNLSVPQTCTWASMVPNMGNPLHPPWFLGVFIKRGHVIGIDTDGPWPHGQGTGPSCHFASQLSRFRAPLLWPFGIFDAWLQIRATGCSDHGKSGPPTLDVYGYHGWRFP